jgi:hypothetical protein
MKVRVLKLKSVNSTMSGSWEFLWLTYDSSNNILYCDIRRKTGPDIASKTKFVTGKNKFKCESFVYHNKSLKHKKCFFKYGKPISQLSIFCLIHGIINYVQINTYWSCIVRIGIFINLASNILLLASKKCFLTS